MGKSSKKQKRLSALITAVLLSFTVLCFPVLGASAVIDRDARGALSVNLYHETTPLADGVFDVYYVASLEESTTLRYTLLEPFAQAQTADGVDINGLNTASALQKAAAALRKYIGEATPAAAQLITGTDGSATADALELGVYLVVQTEGPEHYTLSGPFLVFLPMTGNNGTAWVYEIAAAPKVSYIQPSGPDDPPGPGGHEAEPVDPSEEISEEEVPLGTLPEITPAPREEVTEIPEEEVPLSAPQTGLVQWPVPVLAVLGTLLIVIGLFVGRDNKNHES